MAWHAAFEAYHGDKVQPERGMNVVYSYWHFRTYCAPNRRHEAPRGAALAPHTDQVATYVSCQACLAGVTADILRGSFVDTFYHVFDIDDPTVGGQLVDMCGGP